ncbi:hypothetical protein LTS18_010331 [Coniosporium uncinatum]|uniref:Uncharacterized protein n=1 Tax=Coniosporium uncinatum TaxID=93489 RepID=A0ACC3DWY4_9PEZI|nr:hypothetical protein LTS18_010331 [Coniosporium uncinatum]
MLGGLSVKQKNCDVCHIKLNGDELDKGIHCAECAEDLSTLSVKGKKSKPKKEKKSKETAEKLKARTHRNRKVVDDDDDDEEGDWLVPEVQRKSTGLGKAGDTDDENADGAGDFLGFDDSETDSEAETKSGKYMKKGVINLDSSEVTVDSEEDRSSDEEDEEDSSGNSTSESEDEGLYNHDIRKNGQSLKNLVASTKIRHLVEILRKETPGHKVIVFSQFTTMLDLIEPFLKKEGIVFTRYDGSMRNDLREASLDRLRNDKKTRVLLCSLKCGSLGLNLTAASRVVILEPFWNPFVEEQAIDRVHRLNQTVNVHVYKLTIANTVEERILDLQESKRKLAKAALEGRKGMNKLNFQDIMNLFKHDAADAPEHKEFEGGVGPTGLHGRVLDGALSPRKAAQLPQGLGGMGGMGGNGVYGLGGGERVPSGSYNQRVRDVQEVRRRPEDPVWGRR